MRIVSLLPSTTEILFAIGAGDDVADAVRGRPGPRMAVLEWTDPPFNAGHWVPDMVAAAGATPVLAASGQRSSVITWQEVTSAEPDVIVVSPCGFRLEGCIAMARALRESGKLTTDAPVWAVDADAAFVRPGPRLIDGVEALAASAHPDAMPARPE